MTKATITKKAFNCGLAESFGGLVHYHDGEHGGRKAWNWGKAEELYPDPQAERETLCLA